MKQTWYAYESYALVGDSYKKSLSAQPESIAEGAGHMYQLGYKKRRDVLVGGHIGGKSS
jgi:hypothetical protein